MSGDLEPLSVEEGIQRYLRAREPELAESSLQNAQTRLKYFQKWTNEQDISNLNVLTGRELSDFVDWRRDQISPITLQKQLSTFRSALRYWSKIEAVREGLAEKLHSPDLPDGAEARDDNLPFQRAKRIIDTLDRFHYASPRHVMMVLLWSTAMRRSALRSIDVGDLEADDFAVRLEHRPDTGTSLKNGGDGERWIYLGPTVYEVVEDSLDHPERLQVTDEYGREPLLTTRNGRPTGDTIYRRVNRATQPCEYGECPHDIDPEVCEARGSDGVPSKCPSSVGPHAIRRGSITHHLMQGIAPETVSERCDVSPAVMDKHYDVRSERDRMAVRKRDLDGLL